MSQDCFRKHSSSEGKTSNNFRTSDCILQSCEAHWQNNRCNTSRDVLLILCVAAVCTLIPNGSPQSLDAGLSVAAVLYVMIPLLQVDADRGLLTWMALPDAAVAS